MYCLQSFMMRQTSIWLGMKVQDASHRAYGHGLAHLRFAPQLRLELSRHPPRQRLRAPAFHRWIRSWQSVRKLHRSHLTAILDVDVLMFLWKGWETASSSSLVGCKVYVARTAQRPTGHWTGPAYSTPCRHVVMCRWLFKEHLIDPICEIILTIQRYVICILLYILQNVCSLSNYDELWNWQICHRYLLCTS